MKLLIVGRSPLRTTGLCKAIRQVGDRLAAEHEVLYAVSREANLELQGFRDHDAPEQVGWYEPQPGEDPGHSAETLMAVIRAWRPDTVLLAGEPWAFAGLPQVRDACRAAERGRSKDDLFRMPRFVLWLPVRTRPFPIACAAVLDAADRVLATTEWGAAVLNGEVDPVEGHPAGWRPRWRAGCVDLGVDGEAYHWRKPEPSMFGKRLVIGWVGANEARKHPVHALRIIAAMRGDRLAVSGEQPDPEPLAAHGSPFTRSAALVMKTSLRGQYDLVVWCDALGLKLCLGNPQGTPDADVYVVGDQLSDAWMATLYGQCDVGLCTAGGGAPGMALLEMKSCGLPTLAVDTGSYERTATWVVGGGGGWAGIDGWVTEPHVGAMAAALRELADLKAAGKNLRLAETACPVRGWDAVAEEMAVELTAERADYERVVTL